MTEPNYQKPPLREEIEAFFKQLKGVITAIIYIYCFIYCYYSRTLQIQ